MNYRFPYALMLLLWALGLGLLWWQTNWIVVMSMLLILWAHNMENRLKRKIERHKNDDKR
jgi:hypothetical protein